MNIEQHLQHLLTTHDCVVLPGVGGFLVRREHATIRQDMLLPQRAVIAFNAELTHTDGLLASALAADLHTGYRDAARQVEQWTETLNERLTTTGRVTLEHIGTLQRDAAGRLTFTAGFADFLPDNYGLSPISIGERIDHLADRYAPAAPRAAWPRRMAAAVAAVVGLWSLSYVHSPLGNINQASISPLDWTETRAVVTPCTPAATVAPAVETTAIVTPAGSNEPKHAAPVMPAAAAAPQQATYSVIAAVLQPQAARRYSARLDNAGIDNRLIEAKNGAYYVSVGSFDSHKEAVSHMKALKAADVMCKKLWILTQK
ncbi:MAG: SPOR domain-containing protein [Paludibacteraceae bacterium]|nr:SPOR domain-containing protein [Paludibacteraceae bacterium]